MNVGLAVFAVVTALVVALAFRSASARPVATPNTYTPVPVSDTTTMGPASLGRVISLLRADRDLTVSVMGDSTGNDRGEWVDLFAEQLGRDHRVVYRAWSDSANDFLEPVQYGEQGTTITVWNFSSPGKTAAWPADKLDAGQPERPDLVIYNFGHNNTLANVEMQLNLTRAAVRDKWGKDLPSLVMVQNPEIGAREYGQALVRQTISMWASRHNIPVVDVARAFNAKGDFSPLMKDGTHPNARGSQLWADQVATALKVSG